MKDLNVEYYAYGKFADYIEGENNQKYVNYLFCLKGENRFKTFDFSYYGKDNQFRGVITISFNMLRQSPLNMQLSEEFTCYKTKSDDFKEVEYSLLCDLLYDLSYSLVYLNNNFVLEYINSLVELIVISWDNHT
jgi:hypothetical protein